MAKEIARYIQPLPQTPADDEKQLKANKGYSYQTYKRLISAVCHVLVKASPIFVDEQMKSRNRKDRAFRYTKEQREQLLNAPPSTYVTNPEPEPGPLIFIRFFSLFESHFFSCSMFIG
jgi:hypothetical protein